MSSPPQPQHDMSDFSDSDDPYEIVSHASGQSDDEEDEDSLVEAPLVSPSVFPVRTNSERVDSPQEVKMSKEEVGNVYENIRQEDEASTKSFESDIEEEEDNIMSTPTIVASLHQSQEQVQDMAQDSFEEDHVIRFTEEDKDDSGAVVGTSTKISSLRMPMLGHHLQVGDSFRVSYSGDREHLQQVMNTSYYDLFEKACRSLHDDVGAVMASAKAATAQLGTACELGYGRVSQALGRRLSLVKAGRIADAAEADATKTKASVASKSVFKQSNTVWFAVLLTVLSIVLPMIFVPGMTSLRSGLTSLATVNVTSSSASTINVPTPSTAPATLTVMKTSSPTETKSGQHFMASTWFLQFEGEQLIMSTPSKPSWFRDRAAFVLVAVDDQCEPVGVTLARVNATKINVDIDEARLNSIKSALIVGKDLDGAYLITRNALRKVNEDTEHFASARSTLDHACQVMRKVRLMEEVGLEKSFARFMKMLRGPFKSNKGLAWMSSSEKDKLAHQDAGGKTARFSSFSKQIRDTFDSVKQATRKTPQPVEDELKSLPPRKTSSTTEAIRQLQQLGGAVKQHVISDSAFAKAVIISNAKVVEKSLFKAQKALVLSMEEAHSRTQAAAIELKEGSATAAQKAAAQAKVVASRFQKVMGSIRVGRQAA